MAYNGAGVFNLYTPGNPTVTGTTISSTWANNTLSDIATGLSTAVCRDGQSTISANIPMSSFKFTGLGAGSAANDSVQFQQVQSGGATYLTAVAGTDTITASLSTPALAAYAAGNVFRFVSAGANTGAVTLNVNSIGAKDVTKNGTTALTAGDIPSGAAVEVVYDGARFQLIGPTIATSSSLADSALGFSMVNGTLTASVAASALTVAIKTQAGTDPSAASPVLVYFRSATSAAGDYTVLSITAATSLVISSGSTLGTISAVLSRLWIVGFNDAGTFRLGAINIATPVSIGDDVIASSTAEGGAGGADSAGVYYTTSAVSSKAMRVLGYVESTQVTAGSWATSPSKVQMVNSVYDTRPPLTSSTMTLGTTVAATSGTSIDFTGIPSWVRHICITLYGISTTGTSVPIVQIGDAGGIENTDYRGSLNGQNTDALSSTAGVSLARAWAATNSMYGVIELTLQDTSTNAWLITANLGYSNVAGFNGISVGKALSQTLDRVRLTTVGGVNTFSAGSINILYE